MAKSYTTFIESRHGHLWIVLPDSIDMDNYTQIEDTIQQELEVQSQDAVLDFTKTRTLFSAGIGLIIRLKKLVDDKNRNICIVNLDQKIKEGLENVGMDHLFEIYQTEDAFVKAKGS